MIELYKFVKFISSPGFKFNFFINFSTNTTSSAFTVTLPASPDLGDEVTIVDYAGTFDSNACTIGRNSQPIQGVAEDLVVSTERASFTLVYVDSTQGWLFKND